MALCTHSDNFTIESVVVMAGNGYHHCDYMVCLDCGSSAPVGDCDNETCDNY